MKYLSIINKISHNFLFTKIIHEIFHFISDKMKIDIFFNRLEDSQKLYITKTIILNKKLTINKHRLKLLFIF